MAFVALLAEQNSHLKHLPASLVHSFRRSHSPLSFLFLSLSPFLLLLFPSLFVFFLPSSLSPPATTRVSNSVRNPIGKLGNSVAEEVRLGYNLCYECPENVNFRHP